MRKIVVMEPHEWLLEASAVGNFSVAAQQLEDLSPRGVNYVAGAPVELEGGFVLAADIEDEEGESELMNRDDVRAVFADPHIAPFPATPVGPVGTIDDVASALNLGSLRNAGHQGRGVRIAIVDTGIDGAQVNVSGGSSLWPGVSPGTAKPDHGTMCAVDALIAAPNAQIHDYPLLRSDGNTWVAFLSDAIRVFAEIMGAILTMPGPMVVSNSWGMYSRTTDAPPGNPQNYSENPSHPFNTITTALIASGADVVFAAGNCGHNSPSTPCGRDDIGPGQSILGANSHPDVTTVGAVTVLDNVLGYSSQGPGLLTHMKPDVVSYSHFDAPTVNPSFHNGTSAACPVVAGVIAALRSKPSARLIPPADIKKALIDSAVSPTVGWNGDTGHGTVNAGAAWALV